MGKLLKLLSFATKTTISGGAVYLTVDQRLWGSPEETDILYNKIYEVVPGAKNFPKSLIQEYLPNTDGYKSVGYYWNKGVFSTFHFINNIPSTIISGKDSLSELISSSLIVEEPAKPPTSS